MRKLLFLLLAVTCIILLFSTLTAAQTSLGSISGRISDQNAAVIPGAKVTITNLAKNTSFNIETNQEGLFTAASLPAGSYEISVEKQGFRKLVAKVNLEVAQQLSVPLTMVVGATGETVEVSAQEITINTVTAEVAREITGNEISTMPLLTRNPYALVLLAPGAVDTVPTGDEQGIGVSLAGGRNRSINFLLDGSENNETFSTGPSTIVPVDAIQEFKVQSNNMTAEFGRNTSQANVITKSGTNSFHGSAYEFYRGSALSTMAVEDKVNGVPKGRYNRNVFGGSFGGPIVKDKTFFFGAMEGIRVRSSGKNYYYVPTANFVNAASTNMQSYLSAGGGVPKALLGDVLTADDIARGEWEANYTTPYPGYGNDPAATLLTSAGALIPAGTPLWQRTFTSVPINAGGGIEQNTWSITGRVDHQISSRTNLMGRYAWYRLIYPVGASSDSPYSDFNTDYSFRSQNGSLGLTHTFTPTLFNESRLTYSRTEPNAPLGKGSVNVQCLQYTLSGGFGTGDQMVFPGYLPSYCSGYAIPSGGPQNTYSGYTGFTYNYGRNVFKWGAYARHLRDNHTFGASANANSQSATMQNLINGLIDSYYSLAINPAGHVPGEQYNIATDGALGAPSFTRHYHYNEFSLYFEDQMKLSSRFTLTAGLRWEYLGVLHSPNGEKNLDANLFLGAIGPNSSNLFTQIRDARFQRTSNFFRQDFNNFAPRVSFAWDFLGNQKTVFRAGYGMFYDANFGNALFNAIQNPPNYAVLTLYPDGSAASPFGSVLPNQFDSLTTLFPGGSGSFNISSSARMLNYDMVTAYSQQWNATLEHDIMGKGLYASISYVGSKGDKLYSLNNLNQRGSCIMLGNCGTGNSAPLRRLNQSGLTGMNRRGNEAWSRYNAMELQLKTREMKSTGLQLTANYTWAKSIDNATSFFNDSAFDSTNGNFGFKDPYNPSSSKGPSGNDIRHRISVNYLWTLPWGKKLNGVAEHVLGGWSMSGIWAAQTGGAFTVFEDLGSYQDVCSQSVGNSCWPVVTGALPNQQQEKTFVGPNRSVLYDFSSSFETLAQYCGYTPGMTGAALATVLSCSQQLYFNQPDNFFLNRNTFRAPGYWNFDAAVMKDFRLPREKMKLQFRAEFFNLFNHSNLFADPNTNAFSSGQVLARRGVPPGKELFGSVAERRNIQLALRFQF